MTDPIRWAWDVRSTRYRDRSTGRFLRGQTITDARDRFADRRGASMDRITARLLSGDLSAAQWESRMRRHIRDTHTAQYLLGRGGRDAMTSDDRTRLRRLIADQATALRGFREVIEAKTITGAEVIARARLYVESGIGTFEAGRTRAFIAAGVASVVWLTAADERVCPICQPREGEEYLIDHAPAIPAHVRCRCTLWRKDDE